MKNLQFVCEAQLKIEESANESSTPVGMMEARVTTWGAREGADGRKFNYQPEGFFEWAESFHAEGKPLPMFLNHNDMGMPVGEWYEFVFDETGMTAKGRLFVNTNAGNDVYTVMKESPNLFGGVSVGAYAEEAQFVDADGNPVKGDDNEESYFQITKGGLREVSVVMYPNNPQAEVMKLEALDSQGNPNVRVIEKVLREAGLSRKDATTASSILKRIINESRAPKLSSELMVTETVEVNEEDQKTPSSRDADAVDLEANLIRALELRELEKALSKRIS